MSGLGNIIKKELKELMTIQTFLPIIIVALIFGSMGHSIGGIQEQMNTPPTIGVINEDNGSIATMVTNVFHAHAHVIYNGTTPDDKQAGLTKLTSNNGVALIIIPQNFTDNILHNHPGALQIHWIMKGAGIMDSIPSSTVEALISYANTNISRNLIQTNASVNASVVLNPTIRTDSTQFKGKELTGLSPSTITGLLSSQSMLIPIVMMMIIIMAGSIVITSMALEKENKTLETLLTLPVKRTSIVTGKIAAAAIIGLMLAVIYMIGMSFYLTGLTQGGGAGLASFGLVLSPTDFILIGVVLFITLIAGLSLCMLMGTFAKNFKSAQTLTFPITMLALIPMFLTMFFDFDTLPPALQALTFAIPFSHPMLASRELMFHDYTMFIAGLIYVTIFAVIVISVVVWVFKTDRLLTGGSSKWAQLLMKKRGRRF